VPLVVRGIEQERERHLEHLVDLVRVQAQLEVRCHQTHHRRHAEVRARVVVGELAQDLDVPRLQADLLLRLAQRGGLRRGVVRLGAAARKADLARVRLEMRRAPREQNLQLLLPLHDRHQYRGGTARRRAGGLGALVAVQGLAGLAGRGEVPAQPTRVQFDRGVVDQRRAHAEFRPVIICLRSSRDDNLSRQANSNKGDIMKRLALLAALAFASASAFAFHCPADMKKIDAALAKNPKLSAQQMNDVKKARADGEALHKAGKHQESVDTLAKAMKILNVK
jgi:hypothetical protein